ncbi:uncharacterized protein [Miscanthus floridulus]|uniref:uncharacterized protein n=1 Tax=Miscanthus floridulus TaxID=154761 RepID=UPI003459E363
MAAVAIAMGDPRRPGARDGEREPERDSEKRRKKMTYGACVSVAGEMKYITTGIGYNSDNSFNGDSVLPVSGPLVGAPDIFESPAVVSLTRAGIENLLRLANCAEPWLVVLYAPWCRFCQVMEASYMELAEKLAGSGIKVAKFRADGDQKPFAQAELQLPSFPTELLATSPTRCSTLGLYDIACIPVSTASILRTVYSLTCLHTVPRGRACHPHGGHYDCNHD